MLIIVHQQSNNKYEKKSLLILEQFIKKISIESLIIIVDLDLKNESITNNIYRIPGSNEYREFSSFYIGLKKSLQKNPSLLLFTNETFFRYREFCVRKYFLFKRSIETISLDYGITTGEVHYFHAKPPYPFGNSNKYISTYFVFFNKEAVNILKKINFCIFNKNILNTNYQNGLIFNYNFTRAYNNYTTLIEKSLHLGSHKVKWHHFEKLSETNFNKISLKGFSIVIEHALSQIFENNNIKINDALNTYLRIYVKIVDRICLFFEKKFFNLKK